MKIIIIFTILILLSSCSNTKGVNYQGEWIKSINELKGARGEALRAASRHEAITKVLQVELNRLMQLDAAYQRAIKNSNCPVGI